MDTLLFIYKDMQRDQIPPLVFGCFVSQSDCVQKLDFEIFKEENKEILNIIGLNIMYRKFSSDPDYSPSYFPVSFLSLQNFSQDTFSQLHPFLILPFRKLASFPTFTFLTSLFKINHDFLIKRSRGH